MTNELKVLSLCTTQGIFGSFRLCIKSSASHLEVATYQSFSALNAYLVLGLSKNVHVPGSLYFMLNNSTCSVTEKKVMIDKN